MKEVKNLVCIVCPLGCNIQVEMENKEITGVSGNTCKRGDDYARREMTFPTRIVTSTVCVEKGVIPMVSVKTETGIPKDKIMDVMESIRTVKVKAPVHIGDVVLENAAGSGVRIIATKEVASLSF